MLSAGNQTHRIPLHLSERSALMQGGRVPRQTSIILHMALATMPPQEHSAQIRDRRPHQGREFRVALWLPAKALIWPLVSGSAQLGSQGGFP